MFTIFSIAFLLGSSTLPPADKLENIRAYTREIEFDYIDWTLDALYIKASQLSINIPQYLPLETQYDIVINYLNLVRQIGQINNQIELLYSNPDTTNLDSSVVDLVKERDRLLEAQKFSGPLAETIIQNQVSSTIAGFGLGLRGQPMPPVLYKVSSTPMALIISPRNIIRQDADISLLPDLTIEQIVDLEKDVEQSQDVSALVVRIGGIALYPTMIIGTTDLRWLLETVCHEWTHNYLTLRPLGINYYASPELRTMNETTANIVGKEIGHEILVKYYPQFLPKDEQTGLQSSPPSPIPEINSFDFRKEMHLTRATVDQMLSNNKIEEAEEYMETRRTLFWESGYFIRRLNQAYFAFHGAYADEPGGAAGTDPVGPAVRLLRQNSATLAEFLYRISWMTSYDQLRKAVSQ